MAELFTHVVVGFVIAVILSWKYQWITPPLIPVAMVGAAIPDLNRISLLVDAAAIEALFGIPWSWSVVHRAGGALVVCVLFSLLVPKEYLKSVLLMLLIGVTSHFVIDYFLWQASGTTNLMLWPFLDIEIAYGGFYRSSDRWTAVVSLVIAGIVLVVDRWHFAKSD